MLDVDDDVNLVLKLDNQMRYLLPYLDDHEMLFGKMNVAFDENMVLILVLCFVKTEFRSPFLHVKSLHFVVHHVGQALGSNL